MNPPVFTRNGCFCIAASQQTPLPNCAGQAFPDPTGVLELDTLNREMGLLGYGDGGCGLIYFSPTIAYNVSFGPSGAFQINAYNRFLGYWDLIMFSGVLYQTVAALQSYEPFLTIDQIPMFWAGIVLPKVNINGGALPNP